MTNALLMDMVYVGCGLIFGLIVRKLVVTYCKRPWVGLTDEEMMMIYGQNHEGKKYSFGRAIEAKLKEKNNG